MITEKIHLQQEGTAANAYLYTYFIDNSEELNDGLLRPVVVVVPGGGYAMTSDREAELLALRFLAMGCHAAVLRYSVAPARYPTALTELALAVKYVRDNAKRFYADENRIIVQGSSAGGHLAASLGVFWNRGFLAETLGTDSGNFRPDAMILSYPVITAGPFAHEGSFECLLGDKRQELGELVSLEKQVTKDTPRTFLWHTWTDDTVPVENSLLFAQALRKAGVPTELHIYSIGGHGLGTATKLTQDKGGYGIQKPCDTWMELAQQWIERL